MRAAKTLAEGGWLGQAWRALDRAERRLVRRVVVQARRPRPRTTVVAGSWAGNGWLYLSIGVLLVLVQGFTAWRVIAAAGTAAGVAFCVYPAIKRGVARMRPCEADASLDSPVKALDRYSCPSGHCLAATIVAVAPGGNILARAH